MLEKAKVNLQYLSEFCLSEVEFTNYDEFEKILVALESARCLTTLHLDDLKFN